MGNSLGWKLQKSIDDACKIARRHVADGNSEAHEAALALVRTLTKLAKREADKAAK